MAAVLRVTAVDLAPTLRSSSATQQQSTYPVAVHLPCSSLPTLQQSTYPATACPPCSSLPTLQQLTYPVAAHLPCSSLPTLHLSTPAASIQEAPAAREGEYYCLLKPSPLHPAR